jgi:peptide/nickel transport system substrate-binding protein
MAPADFPGSTFALEAPVGTGPYKLVSFDSVNQVVNYDANMSYHWGAPKIPHVQWVWIAQPDAEIVAFERQEIDYAPWHIWNEAHFRQAKGVITLQNIPIAWGNVGGIVINTAQPYFADARVRQAMFMAINRSQFLVDSGYNRVYRGYFDLAAWARNPAVDLNTRYPYDPEAARQLLQEAGWDFNRQVSLYTTVTGADPTRLALQQMLGEIGMQVELEQVETAVVDKAMHQDRPPTYDLYITGFPLNDPGLGVWNALKCDSTGNFFGYCNPELDALLEQDRVATSVEERAPILQEIEALLAEEVPLIPLTYSPQYVGFSTQCTIARYAWYTFPYMHEWSCQP